MARIPFDFITLNAFLEICRHGSISKAAELSFLSQPALTRRIQALEEKLGCKLFTRTKSKLELTEQGLLLQRKAAELLDYTRRMEFEIKNMQGELSGLVKVGCVESSISRFLGNAIGEFKSLYPEVQFELYGADSDDLKNSLDQGKIDMAFLLEPVEAMKYAKVSFPVYDRWGLVVRKAEFPESVLSICKEEIPKLPLVLPRRYIVQDDLYEWLGLTKKDLSKAYFCNLVFNNLFLIEQGLCNGVAIEGAFDNREVPNLRFLPVEPEKKSGHVLVKRKNIELSQPAKLFWESLVEKASALEQK